MINDNCPLLEDVYISKHSADMICIDGWLTNKEQIEALRDYLNEVIGGLQ